MHHNDETHFGGLDLSDETADPTIKPSNKSAPFQMLEEKPQVKKDNNQSSTSCLHFFSKIFGSNKVKNEEPKSDKLKSYYERYCTITSISVGKLITLTTPAGHDVVVQYETGRTENRDMTADQLREHWQYLDEDSKKRFLHLNPEVMKSKSRCCF